MARDFDVRIINARKVSFALMACDVAIGYRDENNKFVGVFTVPDFILKKNERGYYYSEPSKPYIKNGVHVEKEDANGVVRKQYLKFFKLYEEKGADKNDPSRYAATSAAFEGRKGLIGKMVEAMERLGLGEDVSDAPAPRARTPKPARTTKPVAARTEIDEDEGESLVDDDDLPF